MDFSAHLQRCSKALITRSAMLAVFIAWVLLAGYANLLSEREPAEKNGQKSGLTATALQTSRFPIFAQTRHHQVTPLAPEANSLERFFEYTAALCGSMNCWGREK